jgi:CheY-like chemotaxis protein
VLIVEDNKLLREMLRTVLEVAGHETLEAGDADEALELCRNHKGAIDALVCDLVIPGMTARELVSLALGSRPDIRVIVMSGHSEETVRTAGIPGEFGVLSKPFQLSEALRMIERGHAESNRKPTGRT